MSNLLDSLRFWRFIYLALALAFLVLCYQFSQTGRYRMHHDPAVILDTRTGHIYFPLNEQGQQELTPPYPLK